MAKKEKNRILLAVLLILLVFILISGCGNFSQGKDKPNTPAKYVATGTQGIELKFVANQPPAKVYTSSGLNFLVEVRNKGTYTVPRIELYLTGYDQRMIPGLRSIYSPSITQLEGKSQYRPQGGYTTADFSVSSISLPRTTPSYQPNFLLTACYPYKTIGTPVVCIDPNPADTISDKACDIKQTKVISTGSQGAPVAVTQIESTATPKEMIFRIHLKNADAKGLPFDYSALSKCPGTLSYNDLNKLKYKVTLGASQIGQCSPSNGEVRMVNNQGIIFCKFAHTTGSTAYETTLNVELQYGYKNSIAKKIEIENIDYSP